MKSVETQVAIRKAKFKEGMNNRAIGMSHEQVIVPVYQWIQPIQYPVIEPYLGLIED